MKKYLSFFAATLLAAMPAVMVSCEDEDEGPEGSLWQGELGAPAHEADAVAYDITGSSEFSSIELTESGNYIVIPAHSADYSVKAAPRAMFRSAAKLSRAYSGEYIFGSYLKNADGTYTLENFGILGAYDNGSLTLTLIDGTEYTFNAIKRPSFQSNMLTDRLCRTWYVKKVVGTLLDSDGKVLDSMTASDNELKEEYVKYVIITKAGTFVQVDWDNTIGEDGSWSWYDPEQQIFRYAFNGDSDDKGVMQVSFNGDMATFTDTMEGYDVDYGGYYTVKFDFVCRAQ